MFQEKFMFTLLEGLRDLKVAVWNSNTLSTDDFIGNATYVNFSCLLSVCDSQVVDLELSFFFSVCCDYRIQLQKVLSQGYDDCTWTLQTKTGR